MVETNRCNYKYNQVYVEVLPLTIRQIKMTVYGRDQQMKLQVQLSICRSIASDYMSNQDGCLWQRLTDAITSTTKYM